MRRAGTQVPRSAPQSLRVAAHRASSEILMSRHLSVFTLLALLIVGPPAAAQRGYGRETAEPPLAEDPDWQIKVQQAGNREPRPLAPSVRTLDMAAPAVVLRVIAPTALAVNQDVEVQLIVENVSRVMARNVTVIYPVQAGQPTTPPTPAPQSPPGADLVWKFDTLAAGATQKITFTVKPPPGAAEF